MCVLIDAFFGLFISKSWPKQLNYQNISAKFRIISDIYKKLVEL